MDRPATASPPTRVALRGDRIVVLFLAICIVLSLWLAIPPLKDYLGTRDRAAVTRKQLHTLVAEQARLKAQSHDLSKGTGLEQQARRQGLIDPSERSYVISGVQQP
ncbi:MAG: septum formation initiator family protein [Solirubrobacteraceae bacterium]|nr:septum formation initiator family protein [Patulibacter sp.]